MIYILNWAKEIDSQACHLERTYVKRHKRRHKDEENKIFSYCNNNQNDKMKI